MVASIVGGTVRCALPLVPVEVTETVPAANADGQTFGGHSLRQPILQLFDSLFYFCCYERW